MLSYVPVCESLDLVVHGPEVLVGLARERLGLILHLVIGNVSLLMVCHVMLERLE